MAQRCDVCGKGPASATRSATRTSSRAGAGCRISSRCALRRGKATRMRVCTRCLKAGKVTKVI